MFRSLATVSTRAVRVAKPVQFRGFSAKLDIPTDAEGHQGGRRKEEVEAEAHNAEAFNRSPIIPDAAAGTQENPILVRDHDCIGFSIFASKTQTSL